MKIPADEVMPGAVLADSYATVESIASVWPRCGRIRLELSNGEFYELASTRELRVMEES